jgi:hypothetical protein
VGFNLHPKQITSCCKDPLILDKLLDAMIKYALLLNRIRVRGLNSSCSACGQVTDFCEHVDESAISVKTVIYLGQPSNYQLLNEGLYIMKFVLDLFGRLGLGRLIFRGFVITL